MKKIAVLSLTFFLVMAVVQTQAQQSKNETKKEVKKELRKEKKALRKLVGVNVSKTTRNSFLADFGNIPNVKWKRSMYFDEATFTKDGKEFKAFYDIDGSLVGTTSLKTFADLPAIAQKQIKAKYKGYAIGPVLFYDDNESNGTDMLLWDIQFSETDTYFVEVAKGVKKIILAVTPEGNVSIFKML